MYKVLHQQLIQLKNIRIKYKQDKEKPDKVFSWLTADGNEIESFKITEPNGIGDNYFTYKVDFASSEGANNVELIRLYNDAALALGIKTPPQYPNSNIRVGIDGFPIVAFHKNADEAIEFCSKANFNNDKANEVVYGFKEGDESWEITNNSADEGNFKLAVTAGTYAKAFERRFPEEDGHSDLAQLQPMTEWVASTYTAAATCQPFETITRLTAQPDDWETAYFTYLVKNENLYSNVAKEAPLWEENKYYWRVLDTDEQYRYYLLESEPADWATKFDTYYCKVDETTFTPVFVDIPQFSKDTYYVGVRYEYTDVIASEDGTYTTKDVICGFAYDTAEYRLAKFKAQLKEWFNVDSTLFYYLFTHLFLLVDSRAKNAFPTYFKSRQPGDGGDRWFWLPYDMDTALGINNEGKLVFDYSLEDVDQIDGADVFNGQNSVMWCNLREMFSGELSQMYAKMRLSANLINFDTVESRFEEHQNKWSENIFNEDAYNKYVKPLPADDYLAMLLGSKTAQRRWWLYNRFKYIDSKYTAGDAKSDMIQFRAYGKSNLVITPYADIYAAVSYANTSDAFVLKRAKREEPCELVNPLPSSASDQETYIYSASQLKSIGDLSGFKLDTLKVGNATKLQELIINNGDSKNSNLKELTLGNNLLLKKLVVKNCSNLTQVIDIKNCSNIEEVYFDDTKIAGITLPVGGSLKALHVPDTISQLIIRGHRDLNNLSYTIPSEPRLAKLWLENLDFDTIKIQTYLPAVVPGSPVRLWGIKETFDSAESIKAFLESLKAFKGMDINGDTVEGFATVAGYLYWDKSDKSKKISYSDYIYIQQELAKNFKDLIFQVDTEQIVCTVTFYNTKMGTEPSWKIYGEPIEVVFGHTISEKPADPATQGTQQYEYTFKYWSQSKEEDKEFDFGTPIESDIKLYAKYTSTPQMYEVSFDVVLSGAEHKPESQFVEYGKHAEKPTKDPSYEGITFIGWATAHSSKVLFDFENKPITDDLTLYAQWEDTTLPSIEIANTDYDKISFTLKDSIGLAAYAISTSRDPQEEEWKSVPEQKKYEYKGQCQFAEANTYYVVCKDTYGNKNSSSISVFPVTIKKAAKGFPIAVTYKENADAAEKSFEK